MGQIEEWLDKAWMNHDSSDEKIDESKDRRMNGSTHRRRIGSIDKRTDQQKDSHRE